MSVFFPGAAALARRLNRVTLTTQTVSVTPSLSNILANNPNSFTYAVQYTNTGSVTANNVSVATTLDPSLAYVSASGTGWSIGQSGGVVTATRATAAPGAAPAITITVTAGAAASTNTSATASASNASNASGSGAVSVLACTIDATAQRYCPATVSEWNNVATVAGVTLASNAIYLLQEASGNPADSSGNGFTLTATGTGLAYQQTLAGFARKGISFTDASTGQLANTSASLPSLGSANQSFLAYVNYATPALARDIVSIGGTTRAAAGILTTGKLEIIINASSTNGVTDQHGSTIPVVVKHDPGGSAQALYSIADKIVPTFGALVGSGIRIGAAALNSPTMTVGYAASFTSVLTDAQWKTVLQTLLWSPTWT